MIEGTNCVKCGKEFFPTPLHVYRDWRGSYCCWTCYNHRNDGSKRGVNTKQVEQWSTDGELIKIFKSAVEAAEAVDVEPDTIAHACRKAQYETRLLYPCQGYMWRYRD